MSEKVTAMIEEIKGLTVLELSELVHALEEEFGVSAAAMAAPAAGAAAPAAEEKTDFDVVLTGFDAAAKIKVIKVVREITGQGLAEAKATVEGAPNSYFCLCGMCAELFSGGSFGSSLFGRSAVLLGDLLQDNSQTGNGSQHGTQNLSLQDRQSGNRSQRLNSGQIDGLAVHEAALDLELAVQLLGVIGHDAGGSHGIISQSQRSGAVQQIIQIVQASVVESKAQQGVLHNRIIHAALTALLTQSGVFLNGNTLVVDDDACGSLLDLLGQLGNDCLLLGKDLCVRHTWFHLHENLRRTSVRPGQRRSKRNCPHAERHEDRKASSK